MEENRLRTIDDIVEYCKKNKYGLDYSEKKVKRDFENLSNSLEDDEYIICPFKGFHNYQSFSKHDDEASYLITNKRLLIRQKYKGNWIIHSVNLKNILNASFKKGFSYSIVTINTQERIINIGIVASLAKNIFDHLENSLISKNRNNEQNSGINENLNKDHIEDQATEAAVDTPQPKTPPVPPVNDTIDSATANVNETEQKKSHPVRNTFIAIFLICFLFNACTGGSKEDVPNVVGMDINKAVKKLEKKDFYHYEVVNEKGHEIDESDYYKYIVKKESPKGETSTSTTIKLTVKKSPEQIAYEKAELAQQQLEQQKLAEQKNADAYKPSCESVTFDDLYRNGNSYIDHDITMRGKILQVNTSGSNTVYLVQVTQNDYGYWDDPVMVVDSRFDRSQNYIEDDVIQFYGTSRGNTTYTTQLGADKNVPLINALYIDMSN